MTFDLRGALLRKQEVETARLLDFEFRLRARAMRLLAERIGEDGDALVARIVREDDAAIVADLAERRGLADVGERWAACRDEARRALIAERGDPSPHPLA